MATQTLEVLYQKITDKITSGSGSVNLVPDIFSSDAIASFYKELLSGCALGIKEATLLPSSWEKGLTSFVLKGNTTALGIGDMTINVVISNTSSGIKTNLTAALANGSWSLSGIDWFNLSDPNVNIQVYGATLPVVGSLGGRVKVSDAVTLDFKMPYPIANDTWLLQGHFEDPAPGISNFYQLIGGINLTTALPEPFSTLTDLGLQQIDFCYNTQAGRVDYIALQIGTSPQYQWQILPKLTVSNIGMFGMIQNPGDSQNRKVSFTISGSFTVGKPGSNNLVVSATMPDFSAKVFLESGTIQLGDLLTLFWSEVSIDLKSEITSFSLDIEPTLKNYSLNCGVKENWKFLSIPNSKFDFTITGMSLNVVSQQGTISGKFIGLFNIGANNSTGNKGVDITLFAGYADKTWAFGGNTGDAQKISLIDIAYTFLEPFGIGNIPDWVNNGGVVLEISNVSFLATVPDKSTKKANSFKIGGTVDWGLNFNSFCYDLKAIVDITFAGNDTSGSLTGKQKLMGLDFTLGYKFSKNNSNIYLEWKSIVASYTHNSQTNTDIIEVKFDKMSLGDIITELIASFKEGFQLTAPWNMLNSIDLNGLSFKYTRNISGSTNDKLEVIYNNAIDLGFLKISKISLTKDNGGVFLGFDGTFLGLTITSEDPATKALAGKGSDVRNMPGVPGMGSEFFDLRFLGLGQHIELAQSSAYNSVSDAIVKMSDAFTNPENNKIPIKAGTSGPLVFNENSNWLIGADFTVAKFYKLAFVFNDPNLYGLHVGITEEADYFKNLQFEILYKKINDSIGVYDVELQLPDIFRHLEFGEVSVTLPNIGIKIYTNGNFYVDMGWPVSIKDFSRSFAIQVFPFVGMGGFYFGYLNGDTATGLPPIKKGVFNPVIEAGLALSVGVGKTIDEGILKAGLSLTAVGIFQGIFATYTANPHSQYSGQVDYYYKFQGTLALVGQIYGEVNFAIISASLNITAYISVTLVVEAYMAIPISFEAGVSVSLRVRINLGLFKITIHLGFSATIHADFMIGTNHTHNALWNKVNEITMARAFAIKEEIPLILKWQPITVDTGESYGLYLYFIPHLTVSGENLSATGFKPGPQYVGMTYIDTGDMNPGKFTEFGMTALAKGSLYWALNAIAGNGQPNVKLSSLKDQIVTAEQISGLLCYFNTRPNNEAPFNFRNTSGHDIESFVKSFFSVKIAAIDSKTSTDITASVFPMFPELQMNTVLNGKAGVLIDFAKQSMTGTGDYIKHITALLKAISVSYESQITKDYYKPDCSNITDPDFEDQPNLSMPTFIFTDFMALVIKQMLQNAFKYMNAQGQMKMKIGDIVTGVATPENIQQLGGMASRFMLHGLRLPEPPDAGSGEVQPLYVLTGQQFTVPSLSAKDAYQVNLKNAEASWINFINPVDGGLEVHITSEEIQRILDIGGITLTPSIQNGYPRAMINYNYALQNFSLGGNTEWNYPGNLFDGLSNKPTIWKTPSNFQTLLLENTKPTLDFSLQTLTPDGKTTKKDTIKNLRWATIIRVNLQQITAQDLLKTPIASNIYNLVGADDASISLLEALIVYINTQHQGVGDFISQIQFLMSADSTKGESGLVSMGNGKLKTAIVQANLSTETNPSQMMASAILLKEAEDDYNTLNTPGDFIKLLWECSIVRSGGYYFYYITNEDGKGLPQYLFSNTGTAEIQIVITYNNFIPQPFINSVVTGDNLDFSKTAVYAQSPDVTVLVPLLLPGNVGYELVRNYPGDYNPAKNPPTTDEGPVYLEHQFNLLGVTVPSIKDYLNYMPAGPIEPMSEEDIALINSGGTRHTDYSAPWKYSSVIPYYKFINPKESNDDYLNPYAGIGTSVKMNLNWQDMFGNISSKGTASIPVAMDLLYTDTIVTLSQWPAMSVFFIFLSKENQPELLLNFWFDTSKYAVGDESAQNKARIDLQTYTTLYYQLISGDMSMYYNTTIDGNKTTPEGTARIINVDGLTNELIRPVIAYLKTIVTGYIAPVPSGIPAPYQISSNVVPSTIACYQDALPLEVALTMKRIRNVDPNFIDAAGVATAVTLLKPQVKQDQNMFTKDDSLSLTYFATNFENSFKDQPVEGILLKVATSANLSKNNSDADKMPPLWIVRFDNAGKNGMKYTYDNSKAYFFAPRPLSTSLLSITARINHYKTGKVYPDGTEITKCYSGIDLDNWGKLFLEAVDSFLAPGLAVPAFLLDKGKSLQMVLDAKSALAEAIESTVDNIIIDTADKSVANIDNAKEKWKQQLLIELAAAYKYTAAVQTPVTVNSLYEGSNNQPAKAPYTPRLYGNMVGLDPDGGKTTNSSVEYSLSTAKLPMAKGPSWLTYMFEAKDTPDFRSFEFGNMQFAVSHMETNIKNVKGMGDYLASSWLTFVIPLDSGLSDIGKIIIPNPLRAYPTPPSVTSQSFIYPTVDEVKTIPQTRNWNYCYTYLNAVAAQDTITAQIELNIPSDTHLLKTKDANEINLDEALARFMEVYPAICIDLQLYLSKLTPKDVKEETTVYINAKYATDAFIFIVKQVAEAWGGWFPTISVEDINLLTDNLNPVTLQYTIVESGQKDTHYLEINVSANSKNKWTIIPVIDIQGYVRENVSDYTFRYKDKDNNYLLYNNRNQEPSRNLILQNLDIMDIQNAWGGALLSRNMDLIPDGAKGFLPTNPYFIYQSPLVKFYTKLSAFINSPATLDISTIGTKTFPVRPDRSLDDNMGALFDALTEGTETSTLNVKLHCEYEYLIPETNFPIRLPVFLIPPFDLNTKDQGSSFAKQFTSNLKSWFSSNIPDDPQGTLLFTINVFSSFDKDIPVFELSLELKQWKL